MGKKENLVVVVIAAIATLGLAYFLRKPERRKVLKKHGAKAAKKIREHATRAVTEVKKRAKRKFRKKREDYTA